MACPVIYRIRNLVNGKFYVGSTINSRERFRTHRKKLRTNTHHTPHLQAAWNKYGEECFVFEIMEEVPDASLLQSAEDIWLEQHVGKPSCYNAGLRSGAPWRGAPKETHPSFGTTTPPEERAATSQKLKAYYAANPGQHPRAGKKHTDEAKEKMSAKVQRALAEGRGGKFIPSEETRLRMSQALRGNQNAKGHIRTEEHRRKLSEANRGNTNFKGKRHTEETKEKIRKRVRVEPDGKVYGSLTAVLEHYGIKMPSLRRALLSGKPLSKGPLKGYSFFYA